LQRPEIGEAFEAFKNEKQVGSSTMPHKRNPEICERICGLAKIMRSLVVPALENIPTWHERDLTQSSAERFVIPQACIIMDYMLVLATEVLTNLQIDEKRMLRNMEITHGRMMSEAVMLALTKKGMSRQKAHELIRVLNMEPIDFRKALLKDRNVSMLLNEAEIDEALDPTNYLGTTATKIEKIVEMTKKERRARIHQVE
jgi:adenylosuccinate lyase